MSADPEQPQSVAPETERSLGERLRMKLGLGKKVAAETVAIEPDEMSENSSETPANMHPAGVENADVASQAVAMDEEQETIVEHGAEATPEDWRAKMFKKVEDERRSELMTQATELVATEKVLAGGVSEEFVRTSIKDAIEHAQRWDRGNPRKRVYAINNGVNYAEKQLDDWAKDHPSVIISVESRAEFRDMIKRMITDNITDKSHDRRLDRMFSTFNDV